MRQIVLDTETTGLSVSQGHRIIEIGCIEMVNRRLTGREFHRFLNPERDIDDGAVAVHGITREQLDVRDDFELALASSLQQLIVIRDARRNDQPINVPGQTQLAEYHLRVRPQLVQLVDTGWLFAAVNKDGIAFLPAQVAGDRQTGGTEPEHDILALRRSFAHGAHRIFRLARPINTRMTVMIQNRTMTFGSAQPLSSKW